MSRTRTKSSGWGGARPGAGRPRKTLAQLVLDRTFRANRADHRVRLLEDTSLLELRVEADDPNFEALMGLGRLQQTYRQARAMGNAPWASHLARVFERQVRELNP